MTITGQSGLARDDIERMVRDAEAHAEEDRRRRDEAEVRNNADSLVYQTEKLLRDQGDKVSPADRDKVDGALKSLKDALAGNNTEAIKSATEQLMTASQSFAQRLYEQASASQGADGGGPQGSPSGGPNDEEVVDAEIVDEGAGG